MADDLSAGAWFMLGGLDEYRSHPPVMGIPTIADMITHTVQPMHTDDNGDNLSAEPSVMFVSQAVDNAPNDHSDLSTEGSIVTCLWRVAEAHTDSDGSGLSPASMMDAMAAGRTSGCITLKKLIDGAYGGSVSAAVQKQLAGRIRNRSPFADDGSTVRGAWDSTARAFSKQHKGGLKSWATAAVAHRGQHASRHLSTACPQPCCSVECKEQLASLQRELDDKREQHQRHVAELENRVQDLEAQLKATKLIAAAVAQSQTAEAGRSDSDDDVHGDNEGVPELPTRVGAARSAPVGGATQPEDRTQADQQKRPRQHAEGAAMEQLVESCLPQPEVDETNACTPEHEREPVYKLAQELTEHRSTMAEFMTVGEKKDSRRPTDFDSDSTVGHSSSHKKASKASLDDIVGTADAVPGAHHRDLMHYAVRGTTDGNPTEGNMLCTNIDEAVAPSPEPTVDELLCFVCLEGASSSVATEAIIHGGCGCRGSAGYGHLACLVQLAQSDPRWTSGNYLAADDYSTRWTKCPTCRQSWTGAVELGLCRARHELATTDRSPEDEECIESARCLTQALNINGLYADAIELGHTTLDTINLAFGSESNHALHMMGALASVYGKMGDPTRGLQMQARALAVCRQLMGDQHHLTLEKVHNLGNLYMQLAEYDTALPLLQEAVERQSRQGMNRDMNWTHNLAVLHSKMDNEHLAVPLYTELLQTKRRVLGSSHPETLLIVANLGGSHMNLSEHENADRLLREAVTGLTTALDEGQPVHEFLQRASRDLNTNQRCMTDPQFAVRWLIVRRSRGSAGPAILLNTMGERAEARRMLEEVAAGQTA